MFSVDNRFVFIYNGEIYNYIELKKELCEKLKIKWNSTSDTEVLFNFLINESNKGKINSKSLIDINGIFFCFL